VDFPQRPYTLKNSKLIIYEDFEATTPQQLSVNVPVKLSSGLTLTLRTQGRFYTRIVLIDKYDLGLKTMQLGADSLTRFSWEGLATKIEFTTVRGSSATIEGIITFFDLEGKIIEVKPYIPGDGKHIFQYSAPIGKHISFFEITPKINGANVMLIDEISIDK
jgi:hypothetical protein